MKDQNDTQTFELTPFNEFVSEKYDLPDSELTNADLVVKYKNHSDPLVVTLLERIMLLEIEIDNLNEELEDFE
jgi:hypothetical protein